MNTEVVTKTVTQPPKLDYSVLVEEKDSGYQAIVWGLPDCQAFAATPEEALSNLHQKLAARLQKAQIISLSIDNPNYEHPWMKFAGKYKDDPQFDDMLADIEAYRREKDAQMEEYYRQLDAKDEVK